MNKRIEIIDNDTSVEIQIKAEPTLFVIYSMILIAWIILGIFCITIFTVVLINFLIIFLVLFTWLAGFLLLLIQANWHLCGLEIIRLDSSHMFLVKKINALSVRKVFDVAKIADIKVTTFNDNLLMGMYKPSLQDLSLYPGNLGIDYDNKTYHFAFQIEHNLAVDISTILKQHLERIQSENEQKVFLNEKLH